MNTELKESDFEVHHEFWGELGVDSRLILENFRKMQCKEKSLAHHIGDKIILWIEQNINIEKSQSKEIFMRSFIHEAPEVAEFIYLIHRLQEYFPIGDLSFVMKKELNLISNDSQELLFFGYLSPNGKEILKKVHYRSILSRRGYIICSTKDKLPVNINLAEITEENAETFCRGATKRGNKGDVNVWYILHEDNSASIFIFTKAKSRKKIPSVIKKSYQFLEYSKPSILTIKDKGKTVNVYSGELERACKMAGSIIKGQFLPKNQTNPVYAQVNQPSKIADIEKLLLDLRNPEKMQKIELKHIKCIPKEEFHDAYFTIIKNNDPLNLVISEVENLFKTKLDALNTIELGVLFEESQFEIYFLPLSDDKTSLIVSFRTKVKDITKSNSFVEFMNNKYNISLMKISR